MQLNKGGYNGGIYRFNIFYIYALRCISYFKFNLQMGKINMNIYNKKQWLDYVREFDYSDDLGKKENKKLKKNMLNWSVKDFQNFYGFKGICDFGYYIK